VLSVEARSLFEWEELYYVICGKPQLDFGDLEINTGYEGYAKDQAFIKDFWDIINDFTNEQKKSFLMFCTGSDRSP